MNFLIGCQNTELQNKSKIKKGLASTVLIFFLILLSSCTTYDRHLKIDGLTYSISRFRHDAYVSEFLWDGNEDNRRIDIPDEVNGYSVCKLGGYFGTGAPEPFYINVDFLIDLYPNDEFFYCDEGTVKTLAEVDWVYWDFTLSIGLNIHEIYSATADFFYIEKQMRNRLPFIFSDFL